MHFQFLFKGQKQKKFQLFLGTKGKIMSSLKGEFLMLHFNPSQTIDFNQFKNKKQKISKFIRHFEGSTDSKQRGYKGD